jgi:starch phosphorylase
MKNAMNGGLNLSTLDGWWEEAYDGENGWAVDGGRPAPDPEAEDARDANSFYDLVEHEVVPMFHERDDDGVPPEWVRRVKRSLRTIGPRFSAGRMVAEYVRDAYGLPV